MVTATGREPRHQPASDPTRAILARRRRKLLLPILLLVAVSLVAVSGLLYWSAVSVNQRDALAQQDLVRSIIQMRKEGLRQLVADYSWWHVGAESGTDLEARWKHERLPHYLLDGFGIAAGWVVAPDGRVRFAFESGRTLAPQAAPALPAGGTNLVAAVRAAGSIGAPPPPAFALYRQDLALIAASVIGPPAQTGTTEGEQASVLVFVQPLDLTLFAGVGVGQHIANLRFLRGTVPAGHLGCELKGSDGQFLGSVVWHDRRAGDELLWNMAPLLLVALLAVCLLLFLAIRRVETVVLREGRLSLSLHQEKQRRSQKSDFVSMVSHELRTPLQAISTAADLLERFGDQMSEPERREETRTIRGAVGTLARLVDDVLVMGRAEATADSRGGEPADLARLCRAVWREVSVALRARQQMVLHDGIGRPVYGLTEAALHTILSNLMQNAIKYSPDDGNVEIELGRDGGDFVIAVTDQGPGVPEEEREAVFQPYWRARRVEEIGGTGLGLPVARSAARSLGGDLMLEAPGAGKGARFVLRWPAED